ncbi:MAG: asparagine synthase [Rhodospirillaceae bacterium]|nr:MAG: asparagine synthase [Rhodospirillaceae bacterium]
MCGIAGFLDPALAEGQEALVARATRMAATLHHRGPDDGKIWTDAAAGLAFGHRRLAIVDLSPAGRQPMVSACGRYVIVYNGEVYNAQDIRGDLPGIPWRGHSDTEVIVEACARWGAAATARRLMGMFAFALWDRAERTLVLGRDRLGIKPLYWGKWDHMFLFASELKALRAYPGFQAEIDRDALAAFLRHGYVPTPLSIYRGVRKLEPGTLLTLRANGAPGIMRFWDLRKVVRTGQTNRLDLSDREATEKLEALLHDAITRRMVADVPLGAFLSGGIDSSTVVALMQRSGLRPVKTFSIGFRETGYDEAQYARAVAHHLGTEHTELYLTPEEACTVIPSLPAMFDEPFADSSQLPTFLVSRLARSQVTVALSGDGGDELFAGYNRYVLAQRIRGAFCCTPGRKTLARILKAISPTTWNRLFALLPNRCHPPQPGDKLHKLARVLEGTQDDLYRNIVSHWPYPEAMVPGAREPRGVLWDEEIARLIPDAVEQMQFLDILTYLPDDILTKVDRASMAVSLEARVPLLDHRLVEFSWQLPMHLKVRGGESKWLLRQVLYRYVPRELLDRPKMGFGIPLDTWLRGPLREWAEDLLSEQRLRAGGFVDPLPVRALWQEHLSGRRGGQHLLWDVLMFEAWREHWNRDDEGARCSGQFPSRTLASAMALP